MGKYKKKEWENYKKRPKMGSGNHAKTPENLTKWKTTKPKGAALLVFCDLVEISYV